ncbi:hypothetical protein F7725_005052 [Dissostichus mawsoni]|uniref:Cation/H+ exchanger transmembrane domain-containing protein n=1 Tax=Dissostichus mawsoni TaxID=36200 RepID=A0A7J5XN69_DISMA|nr:hypothetical protein F7725_005052 [Dissostichus mawsoni]
MSPTSRPPQPRHHERKPLWTRGSVPLLGARGKLVGLIQLPTLPPFPPLLGMLLAGLLLRNVPYVTDAVYIDTHWSAALRNIALAVILTRAGLGLDPSALSRLKAVCVRLAVGPCVVEASVVAVVSHFLLGLPWVWGFILGFVLAAVSPAVVVPSMLLLQKEGLGVEKRPLQPASIKLKSP